jgi:hypothetical protein
MIDRKTVNSPFISGSIIMISRTIATIVVKNSLGGGGDLVETTTDDSPAFAVIDIPVKGLLAYVDPWQMAFMEGRSMSPSDAAVKGWHRIAGR